MGDLSAHFSRSEFRDHRTGALPDGMPNPHLIAVLEDLRRRSGGRPLTIVSGYRSPATNAAVGGAADSRHMHGDAADIPSGYARVQAAQDAGARGIGHDRNGWVVHIDVRPGPPVVFMDEPHR